MGLSIDKYEMWASWCHSGGQISQTNMVGKMMDSLGHMTFGTAGGATSANCLESRIEKQINKLAESDLECANVLRIHCGSRDWRDLKLTCSEKAKKAGVTQSKYYRLINKAKKFVEAGL